MSWRDFQHSTLIDNIDKIDKMPSQGHIVDIVDIVERENTSKSIQKEPPPSSSPMIKADGSNPVTPREMKVVWQNHFPKGTPEAREESLRVIEATRRGKPI